MAFNTKQYEIPAHLNAFLAHSQSGGKSLFSGIHKDEFLIEKTWSIFLGTSWVEGT